MELGNLIGPAIIVALIAYMAWKNWDKVKEVGDKVDAMKDKVESIVDKLKG